VNTIYFSFDPLPDLTAFELWTCSQSGRLPQHMEALPPEMLRHFRCIYDPEDRNAAAIASWFERAARRESPRVLGLKPEANHPPPPCQP